MLDRFDFGIVFANSFLAFPWGIYIIWMSRQRGNRRFLLADIRIL